MTAGEEAEAIAASFRDLLPRVRFAQPGSSTVPHAAVVVTSDPSLPAQGYRLRVTADAVHIDAADDAGAFYGRATLRQLSQLHNGRLPLATVEDWPDVAVRGVMLDVSRDKVPTIATLRALIDRLSNWKVNQVQLYMEHTFASTGHEEVWRDASPFTAAEIEMLDAFCRDRHVELVPNQNCLGHMERWLAHDRYRPLAIEPDGWTDQRGRHRPPTTIDPAKPESLDLVRDLLHQLLPAFLSHRVHVGLDEPWELPDDRFTDYLDWLSRLRQLEELSGYETLIWGDIVARHPELLSGIPPGVIVCEWGYEADHPFAARAAALSSAGLPFWVCPGTSSWNTLVGRVTNAIDNCRGAAEAAVAYGAEGYLITDWGDNGHLQYLPVSEPPFAYGAAVSWCLDANHDLDLARALSLHAFADDTGELATALLLLGDVHRSVVPQVANMSVLAMHLYYPQLVLGAGFTEGITDDDLLLADERIVEAVEGLGRARSDRADASLIVDELTASASLLRILVADARARLTGDGRLASVPEEARTQLAASVAEIVARHRDLWSARNRPGGLDDSTGRLERLRAAYLTPP